MWVWINGKLTNIDRFSRISVRLVKPAKGTTPDLFAVVASTIDSPRVDTFMHLYESISKDVCKSVLDDIHQQLKVTSSCIDIKT